MSIAYLPQLSKKPTAPSARKKREQAIAAAIALLAEAFPKAFFVYQNRRRPLKIGIHLDIQAALNGVITPAELHGVLGFYCSNPAYLSRLRKGAWRLNLDGQVAGTVADDEEVRAKIMLAKIKAKKEARTAAAKAQAPPIKRLSLADLKAAAQARKSDNSKKRDPVFAHPTTQAANPTNPLIQYENLQLEPTEEKR